MTNPIEDRDGPRDECGVFGIYAPERDVARLAYFALFALQHRGQESAGIATAARGGNIMALRDQGLVAQVFDEHKLRSLLGDLAIGHVRYSTTGSSEWENTQPIVRGDRRELALAHNGNLINAVELHTELRERGVAFASTSDSEIIAALLATHPAARIEDAVADVLPRLKGAFSTVVMTDDAIVAFRDPHGLRPLALGVLDGDVEGTVELMEHKLTIGPNGNIHAGIKAREVVALGAIQGNVEASDRIEIRKDAKLVGDIKTARIVIEDGAYFKGSIDIVKTEPRVAPAPLRHQAAAATPIAAPVPAQASAAEAKR